MGDINVEDLRAFRDSVLRKKVTIAQQRLRLLQILERLNARDAELAQQLEDIETTIEIEGPSQ